jgi:hypothetical protein
MTSTTTMTWLPLFTWVYMNTATLENAISIEIWIQITGELSTATCPGCFFDLFPDGLVDERDALLFSEEFSRIAVFRRI